MLTIELVLSSKKDATDVKNRKGYADDKWDQEVRANVARKKAASGALNLSKQDKALVDAQLAREAETRQKINLLQAKLQRGVELVSSLVTSLAEQVNRHVGEMAKRMLATVFQSGSILVNEVKAVQTFIVRQRDVFTARELTR
jgi:hypothetical protein